MRQGESRTEQVGDDRLCLQVSRFRQGGMVGTGSIHRRPRMRLISPCLSAGICFRVRYGIVGLGGVLRTSGGGWPSCGGRREVDEGCRRFCSGAVTRLVLVLVLASLAGAVTCCQQSVLATSLTSGPSCCPNPKPQHHRCQVRSRGGASQALIPPLRPTKMLRSAAVSGHVC